MLECPRLARGIVRLATYRYTRGLACPADLTFSLRSGERNDPRASRGIQGSFDRRPCSEERNDPPGKPVAFKAASMLPAVARNVTIHRTSRWHSK